MGQFVNTYQTLTLNGVTRSKSELLNFCVSQLSDANIEDWESDIYSFCIAWLSEGHTIGAHTSGSTGTPKPITLQKEHMIASANKTLAYFNLKDGDKAALSLSANYIAGKMMLVRAFVGGLNLITMPPSSNPVAELKEHVNFMPLVPMQVINGLNSLNGDWPVDTIIIGGGALEDSCKKSLLGLNTNFYETYGMTETVSHIALKNIKDQEFVALSGVRFSFDSRACLCIDAPDVVSGQVVTNDIVALSSSESFTFIGRYDNVINSGGVKLVPEQVEAKLAASLKIPFVISSMPHNVLGEELVLVVENLRYTLEDYKSLLAQVQLSKFEKPKTVICLSAIPLTETGKVQRLRLKELLASNTDSRVMKKIICKG